MRKSKNKNELISLINKADLLEAVSFEIERTAPPYAKKLAFQKFSEVVNKYIADERPIVLIAGKSR